MTFQLLFLPVSTFLPIPADCFNACHHAADHILPIALLCIGSFACQKSYLLLFLAVTTLHVAVPAFAL